MDPFFIVEVALLLGPAVAFVLAVRISPKWRRGLIGGCAAWSCVVVAGAPAEPEESPSVLACVEEIERTPHHPLAPPRVDSWPEHAVAAQDVVCLSNASGGEFVTTLRLATAHHKERAHPRVGDAGQDAGGE